MGRGSYHTVRTRNWYLSPTHASLPHSRFPDIEQSRLIRDLSLFRRALSWPRVSPHEEHAKISNAACVPASQSRSRAIRGTSSLVLPDQGHWPWTLYLGECGLARDRGAVLAGSPSTVIAATAMSALRRRQVAAEVRSETGRDPKRTHYSRATIVLQESGARRRTICAP